MTKLKCVNCGHEWEQISTLQGRHLTRDSAGLRGPFCDLCFHIEMAVAHAFSRGKLYLGQELRSILIRGTAVLDKEGHCED